MDIIEQARVTQKQTYAAIKNGVQLPESSNTTTDDAKEEISVSYPEPLHPAGYYGLTGDTIRQLEPHSEADPVALLINYLTTYGCTIGCKTYFQVEADKHAMKIFPVLVGETSKGRKGTSWGHIRYIFQDLVDNSLQTHSGLASGEGLANLVRDPITKMVPIKEGKRIVDYQEEIVDKGIEDKRCLVIESEFASVLKIAAKEGNILSATLRNAWDSEKLESMSKNSPVKATGVHISIIGHITKAELIRYLTTTEMANGFGNRILWLCVSRSKFLPFGGNIKSVDLTDIIRRTKEAVEFGKNIGEIKWSEETKPIWEAVYPSLSEGKQGMFGSLTGRAEAYVTRLACIYALLDKSNVIRPLHLRAALAVWDYVEASVKYIFRDITGNTMADEIVEALQITPEGLSRTDISKLFSKHKSAEEISNALDFLSGVGKITKRRVETEGRHTEIISLTYKSLNSHNSQHETYIEKVKKFFSEQDTLPISNL